MDFVNYVFMGTAAGAPISYGILKATGKTQAFKDDMKAALKAAPGATDRLIEGAWDATKAAAARKMADIRMETADLKDPETGEIRHVNVGREVVDLRQNIERAEKLRKQAENNTNRFKRDERF